MTLPASGPISLSQVNTELGLSSTALITMNDAAVRTLAGVGGSGTTWSMSSLYGKSNRKPGVTYAYRDGLSRAATNPSGGAWGIASNGSTMVIGGYMRTNAMLGSSTDGTTWTRRNDPYENTLGGTNLTAYNAVATNGGTRFFAGGISGYGAVSNDSGVTWSQVTGIRATTFGTNEIFGAAASSTLFVVCGSNRAVATSPDCVTWTYRLMPSITTTYVLECALFAFSLYWVSGQACRVLTSPDGVTWTYTSAATTPMGGTGSRFYGLAANGTRVVGAGRNNSFQPAVGYGSTVGAGPWVQVNFSTVFGWPSGDCNGIAWNGSVFCTGTSQGYMATSTDGVTWTDRSTNFRTATSSFFNGGMYVGSIAARGSLLVAVGTTINNGGNGLSTTMAYSSDNGATWTSNTSIANNYSSYWSLSQAVTCADASGSKWICAGGTCLVATSTDYGVTWTTSRSIQNNLGASWASYMTIRGVSWYPTTSQFFAWGDLSKGAVSSDGITWTSINVLQPVTGFTEQIFGSLSANGSMIVLASSGIYYTNNGTTWAQTSTNIFSSTTMSACFTGTRWVVGSGGTGGTGTIAYSAATGVLASGFATSSNLSSTTFGTNPVRGLASNGTVTVAVGGTNAAVGTSADQGVTWTYRAGLNAIWGSVAATGVTWSAAAGLFAAVGAGGRFATSPDGVTWTNVTNMSSSSWGSSVTPSGTNYVVPQGAAQVIVSSSGGGDWLVLGANGRCFTSPA